MISHEYIKLPRLYVDQELQKKAQIRLTAEQYHYLRHVLRRQEGDALRLFNGCNGEWLATLHYKGRKEAHANLVQRLLPQPPPGTERHLFFAPIKKTRLDFLIEKTVELGATHLHPILTQNTEIRQIKPERLQAQIIEAAEQCERLDVPALLPLMPLTQALEKWDKHAPVFACLERKDDTPLLQEVLQKNSLTEIAFLIGPEGGFTQQESETLSQSTKIIAVSLGPRILRSETACFYALSQITNLIKQK